MALRPLIASRLPQRAALLWLVAREFGRYTPEREGDDVRHRLTFRVDGRRYRISSVPLPGGSLKISTPEMAVEVLETIRADIRAGRTPLQALAPYLGAAAPENQITHWLARWLERQRGRCESGDLSPTYLDELERWLAPTGRFARWNGWAIWEITYGALEDWDGELARSGLASKTRRNILGAFHGFLAWLALREEIQGIPKFPKIPRDEYAPTIISPTTQDAILEAIDEPLRGIFLGMARLGLRPGEARALNVEDYRDGWLQVANAMKGKGSHAPRRGTKARNVRRLPVSVVTDLCEWLDRYVDPADRLHGGVPLFRNPHADNRDGRWLAGALRRVWVRACKNTGVEVAIYEGTKHSFATALVARGVSMDRVQQVLGHRDQRSTARYAKLADQGVVETLRRPKGPRNAQPPRVYPKI